VAAPDLPAPDAPLSPRTVLDLDLDVVALTAALVDIESVSGNEQRIADGVEAALRTLPHLSVQRDGDAVVARTDLGRPERVVLAGHLDTVQVSGSRVPSAYDGADLVGRGSCDMKGGVAVMLRLASGLPAPSRDVTYVFYDHEEVDASRNGLGRVAHNRPDLLAADFAVLLEPTAAEVEGGCNGTLRAEVLARGVAAHSARAWMGRNAVHEAGLVLDRLRAYEPRTVEVDGLAYREGLNAVLISGGVAGNVIPDRCAVTVNYRFAPDRTAEEAEAHVRDLFDGFDISVVDAAAGARPGLDHPAARAFVAAVGGKPKPKYGWTDVARFSALGVPAVNFGPGDPLFAHRDDERVPVTQLRTCEERLRAWLS